MAGTFPTLSNGSIAMYPVTRRLSVPTRVVKFGADNEQRWRTAPILNGWDLTFNRLKLADRTTLETFFDTQKGAFDATWSFPFNGTSYTSMVFDQDEFTAVETFPNRYDINLRIKQVKKSGSYATGGAAVFPTLNNGIVTQRPFTASRAFRTIRNQMESGLQYARAERNNPLLSWGVEFSAITSTELGTLMDFFASMLGSYRTFSFTDPQSGTAYANCRFAQDVFESRYVTKGQCATSLLIQQFAV